MAFIAKHLSSFTQKEIRALFKNAKRVYQGKGLDILIYPSIHSFGRILVVTPRKIGNAPERNKIRRRLKAVFYQEQLYDHKLDCIVIVKKPAIDYAFDELKQILATVFKQAQA